ncbi:MAG: FAD-binding oxidoreductase [Thermoanaerobaculaceae bacterium]|nr:FAD-binding oxidoreductase [Thermoanaerobaculaceae bacterium]
MPERERRWNGWGVAGERLSVPDAARAFLTERLGSGDPLPAVPEAEVKLPAPRPLPPLPLPAATDDASRLRHACGSSLPDLIALRTGTVAAYPDAVCAPDTPEQVVELLRAAAAGGVTVIPRGGGTSVTGGVTVSAVDRPVVVLSLERLRGVAALDRGSQLARVRAGTLGPELEAALAPHGLRLGHEPQSFEFSSVGGWVATRSAGQRSTGVGKIDDLVAGLEVATETGLWRLAAQPASAAGPELRRLLIGSEGRLGVITEATLRLRPLPECEDGLAVLLPGWAAGVDVCRALLQNGVPVETMRLADPEETRFGMTLVALSPLAARASRMLFSRRRYRSGCLLLLGWAGTTQGMTLAEQTAARHWRAAGGFAVGRAGWRRWRADRFRHPYLRDELLTAGWGVDTLETAAPWSGLEAVYGGVREALQRAAASLGTRVVVGCHLSHAYRDGASLYFTFLWPLARGREVAQWGALKGAANDALLAAGGTLSHHHGVGTIHAPYLEREVGRTGVAALAALAHALDPAGVLNPGVLLLRTTDHGPRTTGGGEG